MTRMGDWETPATVQGQRSGCGAAYQSGGRLCVEADLARANDREGLHILAAFFRVVDLEREANK